MADNFTVLNSAGATVTFRSTDNGSGVQVNMSIPSNPSGTALLGQFAMATSIPVAIASDQSIFTVKAIEAGTWTTQSLQAGTWTTNIGNQATVTAIISGTPEVNVTQVAGAAVALGSTTGASSFPVVIASDQATFTVRAIEAGTWTVQALQSGAPWSENITQVGGLAIALGSATGASSFPVVIASNQATLTTVIAAGTQAIGTVSALQSGAWSIAGAGGTVSLGGGTASIVLTAGAAAIGTVSALQSGAWTVAANVTGFTPGGSYATANFTATSGTVSLPTGAQIVVYNAGTAVLSVRLGTAATVTAVVGNDQVQAGGWLSLAVGTNTILAGITPGGTASAVISGGSGLPAGIGGLSSSGGAGGNVNITQVGTQSIALGSTTSASSFPVVIASNQATLTTVLAAGSQAVGTVTALQGGVWTTQVAGSLTVTSNSTQPLAIASVSTNPPTPVAIKNNTGTLVGINVYNTNSSYPVFLKIFNVTAGSFTSGSINAGTFSATFCCGIPPGSPRDVALPLGTNLTTAIAYYITKFAAANDTTSVATNDLVGMITYF